MSQPTSAPQGATQTGQSLLPDSTHLFTIANLALIVVLTVLVVLGLLYGARLRHRRHVAEDEIAEHNEAIGQDGAAGPPPPAEAPPPAPAEATLAPPPTALSPPPLADGPGVGMPAEPAPAPPAPVVAVATPADPSAAYGPVTQLKGLGPRVAERLAEQGITTVGQLAALSDDEAQALDTRLGPFTGRMGRDRWQEQARFLAAGDRAGFEAVFGRL